MNDAILKRIGKNIRKYRTLRGYTQEALAEKIDVHSTSVSRFELGKLNITISNLILISNVLNIDIKELFTD